MALGAVWQSSWWLSDIGPNVVASVICFAAGVMWARWKLAPRWREHEQRVRELHHQLMSANSDQTERQP